MIYYTQSSYRVNSFQKFGNHSLGEGSMTDSGFLIWFFIFILIVIIITVIVVAASVSGAVSAIVQKKDEDEES